jgi:hypothetical protein
MELSAEQQGLRDRFFNALVEATFPLKSGPDPELALEMLLEAVAMLREHLEHELEERRLELAE